MLTKYLKVDAIDYQKTLNRLARLLRRKAMTAKAVATVQKCSRPIAYQRIQALIQRGEAVYTRGTRESVTGPCSVAYGIR